jgi:hypothetical protein
MTVSFTQMVQEDALTLLSYASPYEVSLEMMRHSDKSLPHKGLLVSSSSHPSGSNTLERVCHPFFKSQSIDDLRKVFHCVFSLSLSLLRPAELITSI